MKRMNLILGRKSESFTIAINQLLATDKRSVSGTETTEILCQKVSSDITENFVTLANEPSLAYFRIQEHIRKSTPALLEERNKILKLQTDLQGRCFDLDYAIKAIDSSSRATSHLVRLNELLKSSLFTKLQLDYVQRQSATFELGVDAASFLEDTDSVASSSRVFTNKKESRVERPPSFGNGVTKTTVLFSSVDAPTGFLSKLASGSSASSTRSNNSTDNTPDAGFGVRQRTSNVTKRALYTRSVDISTAELGNVYSAMSCADMAQPIESVNKLNEKTSFESLSESDSPQT